MGKTVTCGCGYELHVECAQECLLHSNREAHCIGCDKGWDLEFQYENLGRSFVNGKYRKHRANVLLEKEKSKLPEAQQIIEREKKIKEMEELIKRKRDEEGEAYAEYMDKQRETYLLCCQKNDLLHSERTKTVFNGRKCPKEECVGFLSSGYKCPLCETRVCSKCFAIKSGKKDDEHTCVEEDIQSAELIKKETRGCPKCHTRIYKIEGCFDGETPVLLWGGTSKEVKNIVVGDELVGDDGTTRTVQKTFQGEDEMFKVIQQNAGNYTVSSFHTLVLEAHPHKIVTKLGERFEAHHFDTKKLTFKHRIFEANDDAVTFVNTIQEDNIVEITVRDYLKLSKRTKEGLYGVQWCDKNGTEQRVGYKRTRIAVESVGKGHYYGFTINKNHRFVGNDFTIFRNCDQMFCTRCHAAFSWTSGNIVHGVIHNPHFFEWARQNNGGDRVRNPGEVVCGGLPSYNSLFAIVNDFRCIAQITDIYRGAGHIQELIINSLRRKVQREDDNDDIRVKFLKKELDEKSLASLAIRRDTARQKALAMLHIAELYITVVTENLNMIVDSIYDEENTNEAINTIEKARVFCNEQFCRVADNFKTKAHYINKAFITDRMLNAKELRARDLD